MKVRLLYRLGRATARLRDCVLPGGGALVLLASLSLVALDARPVHAGERPDGAHTGVLIEPLADAVDSHGGADGASGTPGAPSSVLRSPQPSPVGPAVFDSWNSRGGSAGDGAQMSDGATADMKNVPARPAPSTAGRAEAGDAAVRALFDTAREALDQGRTEEAQSLFERLVVEAPQSQLAKEARRQLGIIYRSAAEAPATDASAASATQAAHTTASAPPPPVVIAAPMPWRGRARPTQRFEEMLRAEVGDRIFFSAGSAELGGRARAVLERQAEWIAKYPDLYVVVEGHADEPGGDEVNIELALHRADLVRTRLIAAGVPAGRIDVQSRGASERAVTCDGAICRSQNSRAVTRLMVVLPATAGNRAPQAADSADRAKLASGAQGQQPAADQPPRR